MKNIQVIDGAMNSEYAIFQVSDEAFAIVFPNGQDIEFIKDLTKRITAEEVHLIFDSIWSNKVIKSQVQGIHGTLFYDLDFKKQFYPNKKESELYSYRGWLNQDSPN